MKKSIPNRMTYKKTPQEMSDNELELKLLQINEQLIKFRRMRNFQATTVYQLLLNEFQILSEEMKRRTGQKFIQKLLNLSDEIKDDEVGMVALETDPILAIMENGKNISDMDGEWEDEY